MSKKKTSFYWESPELERAVKIYLLDSKDIKAINDFINLAIKEKLEREGAKK
jgi:hypothetical protein